METLYSTCTVTKESGISTRQLYYWEMIGLIQPRYESFGMRRFRRYTQDDVERLKAAKHFLDQGYTLQAAKQMVLASESSAENPSSVSAQDPGREAAVEVIQL